MHKLLLPVIIVSAFLLRAIAINSYPIGFTPDEASFGYDAYSILKTGKDQWGDPWPLVFRSFGDYKMPIYTYLAVPSVAIFGLNQFAVRLPNAIIGTLGVVVVYLLTLELFPQQKAKRRWMFGIVAACLLAISPWHTSLSRGAFEANLTTFFLPLGVWAFLRGIDKPRWMIIASIAFGLNLFSYHSARFLTPFAAFLLLWWKKKELLTGTTLQSSILKHRWAVGVFCLLVFIAFYTILAGGGRRGADVIISNPTDNWAAMANRRYEAVLQGVPDSVARVFSNKPRYIFDQFVNNYLSYFSPQFLFTQGVGERTYGMIPGWGVLYLVEMPFILVAISSLLMRGSSRLGIIVIWLLLAPIPAALAKGPGFTGNRAAVMMPALQILSAYGAVVLYELVGGWRPSLKKLLPYGYIALLLASLVFFLEDYRYHAPIHSAPAMLYSRQQAVEFARLQEESYKEIVFSRMLSEPHIYVAFYSQWDPIDYQNQSQDWRRFEKEGLLFLDQLGEYRLGKYTFRHINYSTDKILKDTLLFGKPEEFPQDVVPLKTIYYPNEKPAILVVSPDNETIIRK